jgi:hypothetical protein
VADSIYSPEKREALGVAKRHERPVRDALQLFPGIGRKRADELYLRYGREAFEVVLFYPERLRTLRGISPRIYQSMVGWPGTPWEIWKHGVGSFQWSHAESAFRYDRSDLVKRHVGNLSAFEVIDMKIAANRYLASRPSPEDLHWLRMKYERRPRALHVDIGFRIHFLERPVNLSLRGCNVGSAAICLPDVIIYLPGV